MSDGLDILIIDDERDVCDVLSDNIRKFYTWGEIITFTDVDKAIEYCLNREGSIMLFILDVFVGKSNGFSFLDAIADKYPNANSDTIMITGSANDDVVDMCVASGVNHLLEKPVKPYALQLAVRSIVSKYLKFAKLLLTNTDFAETIGRF
ncbi:MAG TPA: response regulator [Deltaproteobacteria bacterium]|jgi:response regulator of citrate/malate metabolism|nr:response regulator [Bacteriovoracaceae bacterium]HNR51133.1 response regulator [Deltaproteobacteria bacterium]HRR20517.1 response regulator [Desulfomonilia bacterium]HOE71525.1 response regulator [Deltaproteobacteria bacterium]HON60756.1 response regulator [Deltaproteobacteria bacterium]